jgi:hypothetical protein
MSKIYCLFPTPDIIQLGKSVGITQPVIAANTIAAWQTKNSQPGVLPSLTQLSDYMKDSAKEREALAYALPFYEENTSEDSRGGSVDIQVGENGLVTMSLAKFKPGQNIDDWIDSFGLFSTSDKIAIVDEESAYAYTLFLNKEIVQRGLDKGILFRDAKNPNSELKAIHNRAITRLNKYNEEVRKIGIIAKDNRTKQVQERESLLDIVNGKGQNQDVSDNSNETIDIWSNQGNAQDLSNMAPRPFVHAFRGQEMKFDNVEKAFHFAKMEGLLSTLENLMSSTQNEDIKKACAKAIEEVRAKMVKIRDAKNGYKAREYGNERITSENRDVNIAITDYFAQVWNKGKARENHFNLMRESFLQNPTAAQRLVNTGNAKLTHDLGQNWAVPFAEDITKIREELKQLYKTQSQQHIEALNKLSSTGMVATGTKSPIRGASHVKDITERKQTKYSRLAAAFTPQQLTARYEKIARDFSQKVSDKVEELIAETEEKVQSGDINEALQANATLKMLKDPVQGRRIAIEKLTFNAIYKELMQDYKDMLEMAKEDNNAELVQKYQDIVDNFEALFDNACVIIEKLENLRITTQDVVEHTGNEKVNAIAAAIEEATAEKQLEEDDNSDDESGNRATGNDGWSYKAKFVDPYDSISAKTKAALTDIKRVIFDGVDEDGNVKTTEVYDDLGEVRYYDNTYIHGVLLHELSGIITPSEYMIRDKETGEVSFPALEKLSSKYPWVSQVIDKLKADETLASTFYNDLRKERTDFWKHKVVKVARKDGGFDYIWQTMSINNSVTQDSVIDTILQNFDSGNVLTTLSLYNTTGEINTENIDEILKIAAALENDASSTEDTEDLLELLDTFKNLMASIGVEIDNAYAYAIIQDKVLFPEVMEAFKDLIKEAKEWKKGKHFPTTALKLFKNFTDKLGYVEDNVPALSTREGDKSLPTYSAPNYLETIFKRLKSDEVRLSTLAEEFMKYDFFYDKENKKWKSGWLEIFSGEDKTVNIREVMANLSIMSLDNINGKEYDDWTAPEIKSMFFQQYLAAGDKFAWYNTPIYSDSTTVNFIRMVKYTSDSKGTFKEKLLPKFNTLVRQELGRILQVEKRKALIEEGKVMAIQNFDKNGDKFFFLPKLNDYKVGEVSFLDAIRAAKDANDNAKVDAIINEAIMEIMEEDFKEFYTTQDIHAVTDVNGNIIIKEDGKALENSLYYIAVKELESRNLLPKVEPKAVNKEGLSKKEIEQAEEAAKEEAEEETRKRISAAVDELIEEYFWNSCYATSQIIEITVTDPAFFKNDNGVDFQKRFKQIFAAGTKLNTQSRYGKTHELTVYLADAIQTTATMGNLRKNLDTAVKERRMTREQADDIIEAMLSINATDAQAYRNLESMRSLLDMMGKWDEETMSPAFERLREGTYTKEDFDIVWQTIKPFVFAQIGKPDGLGGMLKVAHQNKNSEFLILSLFNMIGNSYSTSPKMRAIDQFMHENGIDVVQFESAVKAGGQGIIDISHSPQKLKKALKDGVIEFKSGKEKYSFSINGATTFGGKNGIKAMMDAKLVKGEITQEVYNDFIKYFEPSQVEVYQMLNAAAKQGPNMQTDPNAPGYGLNMEVVHAIPYDNFVVQQPTPEHLFDTTAVFGSQFRNLITADLPDNISIEVNGIKIEGKDAVLKTFQNAIIENLLDAYQEVTDRFATIEDLQEAILKTVKGNPKYGREFLEAMEIVTDSEGRKSFNLPMHTPGMATKMEEILNAMFKNAIAKQSIKGGNAILVSDFGFTNELEVIRDEETGALVEVECYMPWYSKKKFGAFLTKKTDPRGNIIETLDIEKLEKMAPDLLELIGYRIPTEGKYSMVPLKIKGFLPQSQGSAIMLPADITKIAGSDFDVDKLFMMFPEFKSFSYNKGKALKDYKKLLGADKFNKAAASIITENAEVAEKVEKNLDNLMSLSEEELDAIDYKDPDFKKWFKEHEKEYEYKNEYGDPAPRLKKIKAKTTEAEKMNKQQRNNMLLDISRAILKDPKISEHFNSPGNFDTVKKAARTSRILNSKKLIESLKEMLTVNDVAPTEREMVKWLHKADLKTVDDFLEKYTPKRSLLSPSTFMYFHAQNMTGGKLIGMYANNTTIQAKTQGKYAELREQYCFTINGRDIDSITKPYITMPDGTIMRISKNCAEFSAASVDNAKDPVLADLLQDTETAPITSTMLRMGMTIDEIGTIFANPYVQIHLINGAKFVNSLYAQEMVAGETYMTATGKSTYYNTEDMQTSIISFNRGNLNYSPEELSDEGLEELGHLYNGYKLFLQISKVAQTVKDMSKVQRADSPNGAIQNTVAKAIIQQKRVTAFQLLDNFEKEAVRKNKKLLDPTPVVGFINLLPENNVGRALSSKEELRNKFRNSSMPMLQAFYSLGIDFGLANIARYYAPISGGATYAIDLLFKNAKNYKVGEKVLDRFLKQSTIYYLSKTKFFGDDPESGQTYKEKRAYYLNEYPHEFKKLRQEHPELNNNEAIKALWVNENIDEDTGIPMGATIEMRNASKKTKTSRMMLMNAFDALFNSNEKTSGISDALAVQVATDLFAYAYYKYGLGFGAKSFGNFFSPFFYNQFSDIVNDLRLMDRNYDMTEASNYYYQFMVQNAPDILPTFQGGINSKFVSGVLDSKGEAIEGMVKVPLGKVFNKYDANSIVHQYICVTDNTSDVYLFSDMLELEETDGAGNKIKVKYAAYDKIGSVESSSFVYDANSDHRKLVDDYADEELNAGLEDFDLDEVRELRRAAREESEESEAPVEDFEKEDKDSRRQRLEDTDFGDYSAVEEDDDDTASENYDPQKGLEAAGEKKC